MTDLILTMTNSSYLFIHQSVHLSTVFISSLMSYSSFYLSIIISLFPLADGELYSADLVQFDHTPALSRTRNVSCFAVDWHKLRSNETVLIILHINSTMYLFIKPVFQVTNHSWEYVLLQRKRFLCFHIGMKILLPLWV